MEKTILIEKIKKWLDYESRINIIQKELKDIKKSKKILSDDLTEIMKNKKLECIDVTQGQILYTKSNVKKGINKKYLADVLNKYFDDTSQANEICQYILENREIHIKENIKLKKDKK